MTLAARLTRLELALLSEDRPALLVVIEDDGRWWLEGRDIDPAAIDPRTQLITITSRSDGPQ